jgi:hypothetical protein
LQLPRPPKPHVNTITAIVCRLSIPKGTLSKGKQRAPDNSDKEEYRNEVRSDEDVEDPNDGDLARIGGDKTALAAQFREEASPFHSVFHLCTKDQQTPMIAYENPAGVRPPLHRSSAQSRVPLQAHSTGSPPSHPPATSRYPRTDVSTSSLIY